MSFSETNTLVDNYSSVRIDVETMARIEISDIEYLLGKIESEHDSRLKRILYEATVHKASTVYQLALKSCKYLNQQNIKNKIKADYPKHAKSGMGAIAKFRDDLFHDGISFIEKDVYYPFGKISGRGFVAVRITKGGNLNIGTMHRFNSNESEFAITSEGIFEIFDPGEENERWVLFDDFPNVTASNHEVIDHILKDALKELKSIWYELSCARKKGDGQYEYSYLNEGGKWELIEKRDGEVVIYKAERKPLQVTGSLTITPPDSIRMENNTLIYE